MSSEPGKSLLQMIREDGRYPADAFALVHEALAMAARREHGDAPPTGPRHVTGRQLCLALRDLAAERWGPMARAVLEKWNVHRTVDIGQMVFLMVEKGFMTKTDEDTLADFNEVFDFTQAFAQAGRFEIKH